ncbi:piggyBac transposable element-derived protein 4-like [Aphomia sociella]
MATNRPLRPNEIEEYINEAIENEDCSETEDYLEVSEHESESEQEGDNNEVNIQSEHETTSQPSQGIRRLPPDLRRTDLDCVPLSILRNGYYIGKDNSTVWRVEEPTRNVRTRRHNIIREVPGPCLTALNSTTPLEIFCHLFTDEMLTKLVYFTNIYITEKVRDNFERERDCKPTNIKEMKALLGILFYIGKLRGAHLNTKDLWATDGSGCDICISAMSRYRFHFLLRCLRFDDIRTRQARKETDKLAPIREFFEDFVSNIQKYYKHGEHVTIDEMLLAFRGRCPFRQYLPSKPAKYGLKILAVCDAKTYYTSNLEIYAGKQPDGPYQISNSPSDVVKRLVDPIKGSNRNVVMDNWFMSVPLTAELLDDFSLTCLGTLRKNKKEIPEQFTQTRGREAFETYFGFQNNATLVSYVPKRGKVVLLTSTMHHDAKIDVQTGEKKKPEIITDYNTLKCGVDIVDQMTGTYSVSRRTQRWPLCIFFGLLNIGGLNTYIIQKANFPSDNFTRRDFIKTLAISLIYPHLHDRISLTNIPQHIKNRIRNIIPEVEPTAAASNPPSPMGGRKVRCGLCDWKKDRKTKIFCVKCNIAICGEHMKHVCSNCYN